MVVLPRRWSIEVIDSGRDLIRWQDEPALLKQRQKILAKLRQHLIKEQPPEKRTHADVGKVIAVPSDPALPRAVVTEVRMIERLRHEPVEGYGAAAADRLANEVGQRLIAREHTYV